MRLFISIILLLFGFVSIFAQNNDAFKKKYVIARELEQQEKYDTATIILKECLFLLNKEQENKSLKTKLFNEIGLCNYYLGNYDSTLFYYHKVLKINKETNKEKAISTSLNNIGMVYKMWGQYDKSIDYFGQALIKDIKNNNKSGIASCNNNIGSIYHKWGDYEQAINYYLKAFKIDLELDNKTGISKRLNNIASVYNDWKKYEKAIDYYLKSLDIDIKTGNERSIAIKLNNLASIYKDKKDYVKALDYYSKALDIDKKLNNKKGIADRYNNIGIVNEKNNDLNKAIESYNKAIQIKEELRLTAPSDIRRDYLASQIGTYQHLISTYLMNNDYANAFNIIELSSAKVLSEKLSDSNKNYKISSLAEIQKSLPEDKAIILYSTINQPDISIIYISSKEVKYVLRNKSDFVSELISNQSTNSMIMSKLNMTELKKFIDYKTKSKEEKDNQFTEDLFEKIIHTYRNTLIKPDPRATKKLIELSNNLYNLLINPILSEISDKKDLIIVPSGILGFLPFESLINPVDNKFLVEPFNITYTQSLSIYQILKNRKYSDKRKELLAFGSAVYNKKTYKRDMKNARKSTRGGGKHDINKKQLNYIQKKIDMAIGSNLPLSEEYKTLGYESWKNLSGSLIEVDKISEIIPNTKRITGKEVNEQYIKELSETAQLKDYKVLHFSCHGMTIPEIPEMSALVLSQIDKENVAAKQDGYLRMGEISDLKINADFVNLSACETGLGKIYAGEGVVGLSQSFLIAGANGISVSLWEVSDEATAEFMTQVYKIVKEKKVSYSEAITISKRMFINGDFGYYFKNPFYWSAFVYYGK